MVYGGHPYPNISYDQNSIEFISKAFRGFDILRSKMIHTKRKFDASVLEALKPENILHFLDEELIRRLDSSVQLIDRLAFDAVAGFASIQSVIFSIIYFILIDLLVKWWIIRYCCLTNQDYFWSNYR